MVLCTKLLKGHGDDCLWELSNASGKKVRSPPPQQRAQSLQHIDRFCSCLLFHLFAGEGVSISVTPSYNLYVYRDMAEE